LLDFTELSTDGQDLELLVREILFRRGFSVYWSGRGVDGGRDLICVEHRSSFLLPDNKRWLIQCKHNAVSGKAVGKADLDNVIDGCQQHQCQAYLLVCSTYPSSGVVQRLEAITSNPQNSVQATFWDAVQIERILSTPRNWALAQRFFPVSANALGWNIYATTAPNRWIVNYKGYYFHLSNRIGSGSDLHLESIKNRVSEIENLEVPEDELVRIRAVYYDDKNGGYTWNLDYLYPYGQQEPGRILREFEQHLGDGCVLEDGQSYTFEITAQSYSKHSDHFDPDHYDYYQRSSNAYLIRSDYGFGEDEDEDAIRAREIRTREEKGRTFGELLDVFSSLSFIKVARATNAQFEELAQFNLRRDWSPLIYELGSDHLLSAWVLFRTSDEDKLKALLTYIPQDVDHHFRLTKVHVYLPAIEGKGSVRDSDEGGLYELRLSIHPSGMSDKASCRKLLNTYFREVIEGIKLYKAK